MAKSFQKKMAETYTCKVRFHIQDADESYTVIAKDGEVTVQGSSDINVDASFTTTKKTLNDILTGKLTAFTAAGKAHVSDAAPLDWEIPYAYEPEKMKDLYFFLMHFFNTSEPEKIPLGEEHARRVHGAHAIPLYYHPGFRSAWYMVKKDDQLNEAGDTNPFPQAMVIIDGKGHAKIGEKTVKVKEGEAYYVPPNTDHVVWTEEESPLILIWFAWGEGA